MVERIGGDFGFEFGEGPTDCACSARSIAARAAATAASLRFPSGTMSSVCLASSIALPSHRPGEAGERGNAFRVFIQYLAIKVDAPWRSPRRVRFRRCQEILFFPLIWPWSRAR